MDYTMQLIVQVFVAIAMIAFVALNAMAVFAVFWVLYHKVHDHWSMRQVWQHARARLSI